MRYDSLPVPWFFLAVEAHYLLIYYSLLFLYVFSEIYVPATDISDMYS